MDLAGIAAISGHQIETRKRILETYLPRTTRMADAAIDQLEAHRARRDESAIVEQFNDPGDEQNKQGSAK